MGQLRTHNRRAINITMACSRTGRAAPLMPGVMSFVEKLVVVGTLVLSLVYIIGFNLNVPHYWSGAPQVFPDEVLNMMFPILLLANLVTLIICIIDSGRRNLENRHGWIAYMVLIGAVGIPHYYIKYGRFPIEPSG